LHYAGRAGTGFTETELERLARVLKPLETSRMPLDKSGVVERVVSQNAEILL
jgi:ATP-dependent DNA ligase